MQEIESTIEELIKKLPEDSDYKIVDNLQIDNYFFDAYEFDKEVGVKLNIDKAKEVQRNKWREARKKRFEKLDLDFIESEMQRRKPGQSSIVTQRKEEDSVQFYSGIFEGKTTGTPIGFLIHNKDQKSKDYSHIKDTYRPSHADFVYDKKYGHRDYRGGGRSSARETASRVVAGAIAKLILKEIKITAHVSSVGEIKVDTHYSKLDFSNLFIVLGVEIRMSVPSNISDLAFAIP